MTYCVQNGKGVQLFQSLVFTESEIIMHKIAVLMRWFLFEKFLDIIKKILVTNNSKQHQLFENSNKKIVMGKLWIIKLLVVNLLWKKCSFFFNSSSSNQDVHFEKNSEKTKKIIFWIFSSSYLETQEKHSTTKHIHTYRCQRQKVAKVKNENKLFTSFPKTFVWIFSHIVLLVLTNIFFHLAKLTWRHK